MEYEYTSYCRYSSHLSRDNSIEDQHRINLQKFADLGIPESQVTLIADRAIAGTHEERPEYQRMMDAVDAGKVKIIVVDDQSRLTRAPDIGILLERFRFHNVRFIAVADGVDTLDEGTEVNAEVKGLVNNLSNKGHAKRTRRGVAGRALDKRGSAGDYPFGYTSDWEDPEAAKLYNGHGSRPTKIVKIDPEQSKVVQLVFHLFTALMYSINKIARKLNADKTPLGRRSKSKSGWSPTRIRKMLINKKYIGEWRWGVFKIVKHKGKKKYHNADPGATVYSHRPELAIIERNVFEAAARRLEDFKGITGQRHNPPKKSFYGINFSRTPVNLLSGLLYCGECGNRLRFYASRTTAYYKCPAHYHGGDCGSRSVVNLKDGEKVLVDFLKKRLSDTRGWLDDVYNRVVEEVKAELDKTPEQHNQLLAHREDIKSKAERIMEDLEKRENKLLRERLDGYEVELDEIDRKLIELDNRGATMTKLPKKEEIADELTNLLAILREDPTQGALLLQKLIGKIKVYDVIFPGKKRGYARLEFQFDPMKFIGVGGRVNLTGEPSMPEDVVLYTGEPTKLERLLPQIHEWVTRGVSWKEIQRRTGLSICGTNMYYKRWLEATGAAKPEYGTMEEQPVPNKEEDTMQSAS